MVTKLSIILTIWIFTRPFDALALDALYHPHGASIEKQLEQDLFNLLPVYALGIEPRQEVEERGIPASSIPRVYINQTRKRIERILHASLMSVIDMQALRWRGYANYAWRTDYLIGRSEESSQEVALVFVCAAKEVNIIASSNHLFSIPPTDLDPSEVVDFVGKILSVPSGILPLMEVQIKTKTINGTPVAYGIIRCEWNELTPRIGTREWWSYLPYWYTNGKLFLSVADLYPENDPSPATSLDPWRLEDIER